MRHLKAELLFVVGDGKPVFDELNAGTDQHSFEFRDGTEEFLVFVVGAEAHHALDTGTVVPAPVKQDDLAGGRKMGRHSAESTTACVRGCSALAVQRPCRREG